MLKSGWTKDTLPAGSFKEEEDSSHSTNDVNPDTAEQAGQDSDIGDDDEDESTRFAQGHLRHWWMQSSRLPLSAQPVFCPRRSFRNCFVALEERALP